MIAECITLALIFWGLGFVSGALLIHVSRLIADKVEKEENSDDDYPPSFPF